jgi:PleD family two-component response regulator
MRQLADFVKNLQANKIATRLDLDLGPRHVYNEIDLVVDGFRTMQDSLQKHIENQDALVSERTVQLQQAMDRLKKLSVTDVLTGCYNRLFFNERMPGEMHRAIRYERDLAVVFCDIDFFKSVNDQYGHAVGDDVLIVLSSLCKESCARKSTGWYGMVAKNF